MKMKEFEFNENGVCVNPNVIFRTTANNKNNTYSSPHFSISTAEDIKEHIMDYVKWKGAKEPSYLESKLIGLADDIIHPKPIELSLF